MTDKEKLKKLKKLADAMYYTAQFMTTDASRLHKAMDEYHQFVIYEYYKEEPVSKVYTFKAIPRLLDMIQPSDRAKTYITKLADSLDEQGYHTDAKIVRESLKIMNGEKVAMATMDEESVSEDLEKAASRYAKEEYNHKIPATLPDRCRGCYAPLMYAFKAGANWQKEKFEKNRLKHCGSITNEQAELEQGFIDQHLDKYQRMPTFLDAVEYGMRLQKEQMMKDAVEAKVYNKAYPTEFEIQTNTFMQKLKHGNNVKLIIIK